MLFGRGGGGERKNITVKSDSRLTFVENNVSLAEMKSNVSEEEWKNMECDIQECPLLS